MASDDPAITLGIYKDSERVSEIMIEIEAHIQESKLTDAICNIMSHHITTEEALDTVRMIGVNAIFSMPKE